MPRISSLSLVLKLRFSPFFTGGFSGTFGCAEAVVLFLDAVFFLEAMYSD
jgi:hypothetical protein